MIITIVLVIVSILALGFFLLLAVRGHASSVHDIADLEGMTQPLDLLAFRNLTDPAEEKYLRGHLSTRDFRQVQRQRLWAAIAYLDCVAANAAVLLRLGEAARRSQDPQIAAAGLVLVNNALRLRLYTVSAQARFYLAILVPGVRVSPAGVSDLYEQLTGIASTLGYLQSNIPARRVAAIL